MFDILQLNLRASILTALLLLFTAGIFILSNYVAFIDPFSLLIVFGGTLLSGSISYELPSIVRAVREAYYSRPVDQMQIVERVAYFSNLSHIVRQKGNIALEKFAHQEDEPLMKKGLQLVADGTDTEELRHMLNTDVSILKTQKTASVEILFYLASVAPAAGLIGTVTGLIFMLSDVENTAQLSTGMSLALLTTLYGAVLSYLVLQPLGTRLEKQIKGEEMLNQLSVEGIIALSKGSNPQLMQERLEAFAG
jgi:chemotaxis protein MotA